MRHQSARKWQPGMRTTFVGRPAVSGTFHILAVRSNFSTVCGASITSGTGMVMFREDVPILEGSICSDCERKLQHAQL